MRFFFLNSVFSKHEDVGVSPRSEVSGKQKKMSGNDAYGVRGSPSSNKKKNRINLLRRHARWRVQQFTEGTCKNGKNNSFLCAQGTS